MNRLEGVVDSCAGESGVCAVAVRRLAGTFDVLVFGRPGGAAWLEKGRPVAALFKESDVLLAPRGGFAWPGSHEARVERIERNEILSRVYLEAQGARISALVPVSRLEAMGVVEGGTVEFWVPPHEIVLEEVQE